MAKVEDKISLLVSGQIPAFIQDEHVLFTQFLKYYFEFLETICVYFTEITSYDTDFTLGETVTGQTSGATGTIKAPSALSSAGSSRGIFILPTSISANFIVGEVIVGSSSSARVTISSFKRKPLEAARNFEKFLDIDETTSSFLELLRKEFADGVKDTASVDKSLFIKQIANFYRAKGSEKGFETLFRSIFGQQEIEFYYPKTDLLVASGGTWIQENSLHLQLNDDYNDYLAQTITGLSSGATAYVDAVTQRKVGQIQITELSLTKVNGTFTSGETIRATVSGAFLNSTILGQLGTITITNAGAGYSPNTAVTVTGGDGINAEVVVSNTAGNQVTSLTTSSSGSGYQVGDTVKFDNAATGATASARAQIKNLVSTSTETISFFTDRVYEMMTTKQFTYTGTLNRPIKRGFYIGDAVTYAESSTLGLLLNINEINNELLTEDFLRLVDESGNALVDELSIASSTVRYELLYAVTYNFLTEESERIIAEDSDAFVNETDYVAPIDFTDGQTIYFYDTNKTNFTPSATATINSSPSTISTTVGLNATDYGSIFNDKSSDSKLYDDTSTTTTDASAFNKSSNEFGEINTIEITSFGDGYDSKPTATITNSGYFDDVVTANSSGTGYKGTDASLAVDDLGGGVTQITVNNPGTNFFTSPTLSLADSGDGTATATAALDAVKAKTGYFSDTGGQPSSPKKLQDNDYYQDFSYVLKTTDSINIWREDVNRLMHPAGYNLFGEVNIRTAINARMLELGANDINDLDDITGFPKYKELTPFLFSDTITSMKVQNSKIVDPGTSGHVIVQTGQGVDIIEFLLEDESNDTGRDRVVSEGQINYLSTEDSTEISPTLFEEEDTSPGAGDGVDHFQYEESDFEYVFIGEPDGFRLLNLDIDAWSDTIGSMGPKSIVTYGVIYRPSLADTGNDGQYFMPLYRQNIVDITSDFYIETEDGHDQITGEGDDRIVDENSRKRIEVSVQNDYNHKLAEGDVIYIKDVRATSNTSNQSFGSLFGSSDFSTAELKLHVGEVFVGETYSMLQEDGDKLLDEKEEYYFVSERYISKNWFTLQDANKLDFNLDNNMILENGNFIIAEDFSRMVSEEEGLEYELGVWDFLLEDEGYLLGEDALRVGQEVAAVLYKPSKRVMAGIPITTYHNDTYMNWNIHDLKDETIEPFVHNEPADLTNDFSSGDMTIFDKIKIDVNVDNLQLEDASGSVLREDTHSYHLIDEDHGASSQLSNDPPHTIGSSVFDPQLGHTVFVTEDNNPFVHEDAVMNSSQFGYVMTEADTLDAGQEDNDNIMIADMKSYKVDTVDSALQLTLNIPPEPPIIDSNGWFLYRNHKIFKEQAFS